MSARIPASKDTLFMRGFGYRQDIDKIRSFFGERCGKSTVEFFREDGKEKLFLALKFESKEIAKEVLQRYNETEILGDKIYMTWYKDLRRARPNNDYNRQRYNKGGRDGYYGRRPMSRYNNSRRFSRSRSYSGSVTGSSVSRGSSERSLEGRRRRGDSEYKGSQERKRVRSRHHDDQSPDSSLDRSFSKKPKQLFQSKVVAVSNKGDNDADRKDASKEPEQLRQSKWTDADKNESLVEEDEAKTKKAPAQWTPITEAGTELEQVDTGVGAKKQQIQKQLKEVLLKEALLKEQQLYQQKQLLDTSSKQLKQNKQEEKQKTFAQMKDKVELESPSVEATNKKSATQLAESTQQKYLFPITKQATNLTGNPSQHKIASPFPNKNNETYQPFDTRNCEEEDEGLYPYEQKHQMPKKAKEPKRDPQVTGTLNGKCELDEDKLALIKAKKEEVEKVYRQDCETFSTVTKLLINKDPDLEDRLQKSLRENLRDIGHRSIQELKDFVEKLKKKDIREEGEEDDDDEDDGVPLDQLF